MLELLQNWLSSFGLNEKMTFYSARLIGAAVVLILSTFADYIAKRYIVSVLRFLVSKSRIRWDDAVVREGGLTRLAHLAPALVIYLLAPVALESFDQAIILVRNAVLIYMIAIFVLALVSLLNTVEEIYQGFPRLQRDSNQGVYPGPETGDLFSGNRSDCFNPD